jgi:hypothetical protein
MSFAEKFCVCEKCQQTWELGQWGWMPIDPDYEYHPRPRPRGWKKKGKKR